MRHGVGHKQQSGIAACIQHKQNIGQLTADMQVCADTPIGNEMIRGISGGQKKRVTLGEKLVGPKQVPGSRQLVADTSCMPVCDRACHQQLSLNCCFCE